MRIRFSLLVFSIFLAIRTNAQAPPNLENGFKAYGSYDASKIDTINLSNGGLTIHIPLPFFYGQRGGKLNDSYFLISNSKHWGVQYFSNSNGVNYYWDYGNGPYAKYVVPLGPYLAGTLPLFLYRTLTTEVDSSNSVSKYDGGYYLQSAWDGSVHQLFDTSGGGRTSFESTDTSGYRLVASNPDSYGVSTTFVVTDRHGNVFQGNNFTATTAPACTQTGNGLPGSTTITTCPQVTGFSSITDANGNFLQGTDTLGRNAPLSSISASDSTGCVSSLPFVASTISNYTGTNGATEQLKVCNGNLSLQTNFSQSNVSQFPLVGVSGHNSPNPVSVITTMVLPNSTKFTLTYDSYGEVTNIGLPTGGSISYTWTEINLASCGGGTQVSRAVASRTVYDGTNSFTANYSWGTPQPDGTLTNSVTNALGNDTVHAFSPIGFACNFYETTTKSYQGTRTAGQLVRQVDTTYLSGASATDDNTGGEWIVPTSIKTTDLASGKVSLVQKTYDPGLGTNKPTFGEVTSEKDYDWGSGTQGSLLREIDTTYLWQNDSRYLTANLLDLPASVITKDGGGNRLAETDYTYDESSYLTPSSVAIHHGAAPNQVRGNPTTVSEWLNTTGGFITSHTNWYDTGEVYQSLDPLSHLTTYSYSGTFDGAYPTTVTNALNQSATYNYDFGTGLLISSIDPNGKTTSYSYDGMFRLFQVNRPDSGLDNVSYQESAYPFSAILTKKITSSINIVKTNAFDGVGRLTQSRLTSDPQGIVYANTSYDALGHVSATSNPYRSTSESTYGVTTALYDAIGRVCVVIPPDGSSVSGTCPGTPPSNDILTSHSGNITTVVDQAGKQRRSVTDGLGRLVEVDEPNPGAAATLATGNIAISGSEQSATSQAAASGTGSVTINGTVQSVQICVRTTCHLLYDTGTVTISVNGFSKSVSYGQTSTGNTLASALAAAFNGDGNSPVNAGPSNNIVMLTAKATGASTNYSLSSSSGTSDTSCTNFCGPSFTTSNSGSTLTGGHNASTISDSGSVTITVNGTPYTSTYGSADTTTTIAASLANQVNAGAFASASASGPMVSLTSKTSGTSGNYSLAASYTYNTSQFAQPSFTTSTSGSTLSGGRDANALNNSPFVTLYAYDALSNLTCVVQKGVDTTAFTSCASAPLAWRPRSFVYDSLSHLRSASNPEAGTIAYTYDNDGKVLTKTDARGIQTTFSYDSLDRITGKTYSNGDPSVGYTYDAAACLGASACSNIGRRTGMTDAAGSESWSYDAMGRPLADQRTTNGTPKTTSYTYNLDGSLATLSYLSGRTITYTPNSAGRIVSAIDSANSISYATNALYAPQGSLTSFQNGSSIVSTFYFNNRLQPCRISVKNTGNVPGSCIDSANIGNILDYTYNFSLGASDNGNVSAITNNRDNTRSQNFTYDALNRLASAQTQTTGVTIPNSNCWGLNYGYDAWGNLLYGTFTGPSGCGQPMPLNVSATTSNQIPGYCYDVAGNLLDQGTCPTTGSHTYSYNAENQMVSAAGVSYLYDGDGKRVQKSNGKLYWYGMGSDPLDETDASGNLLEEYIFFNGKRIARRDSSNTVMYYFGDHLGTSRVTTSATGTVLDDSDFYPFGGERAITSSSGNGYKFTGKERDAESGLDEFGARYYSSVIGRFTSPDWSASPEAVPYVNLTNPQTLNLYGYVKNNPLSTTDPDGHCPACVIYVEELITSPEGQAILDNAIGITVAGAAAGYAGAKGWFDKAADFIIQQPFDDPTLTGYKSLHTLTDDAFQQPLQKSDQQVNEEVKQEAGGKCEYCGATTQDAQKSQKGVTPPGNEGQTDHYKPTSRGGSNEKGNKVHACRGCNRAKSDADPTNPNDAAGRKWQLDRMKDRKPPKDKPIRPQAEGLQ